MKIIIIAKKEDSCKGGYGKPKGKLDTQLFPECEGTKYDRDIVKKTREKKEKKTSSCDVCEIKRKNRQ